MPMLGSALVTMAQEMQRQRALHLRFQNGDDDAQDLPRYSLARRDLCDSSDKLSPLSKAGSRKGVDATAAAQQPKGKFSGGFSRMTRSCSTTPLAQSSYKDFTIPESCPQKVGRGWSSSSSSIIVIIIHENQRPWTISMSFSCSDAGLVVVIVQVAAATTGLAISVSISVATALSQGLFQARRAVLAHLEGPGPRDAGDTGVRPEEADDVREHAGERRAPGGAALQTTERCDMYTVKKKKKKKKKKADLSLVTTAASPACLLRRPCWPAKITARSPPPTTPRRRPGGGRPGL